MTQALRTPRTPVFAVPAWLRFRQLPAKAASSALLPDPEELEEDRATSRAMLGFLANGTYAAFSITLHYGWIDRGVLKLITPYYHYLGTALFGTMLGFALVSRNRRAHLIAWSCVGLMALSEVVDAIGLPSLPWGLTRLPLAGLLLATSLGWFARRWWQRLS